MYAVLLVLEVQRGEKSERMAGGCAVAAGVLAHALRGRSSADASMHAQRGPTVWLLLQRGAKYRLSDLRVGRQSVRALLQLPMCSSVPERLVRFRHVRWLLSELFKRAGVRPSPRRVPHSRLHLVMPRALRRNLLRRRRNVRPGTLCPTVALRRVVLRGCLRRDAPGLPRPHRAGPR